MDEKKVRSGEEVERQKKNQTSIDSAACLLRRRKKRLESHGHEATQSKHTHRQTLPKVDRKTLARTK